MKPKTIDRRTLLRLGSTTLAVLGFDHWTAGVARCSPVATASTTSDGVLVVFLQRGAADGLHMVPPYRERGYRSLRGHLALAEPGRGDDRTLDLGDGFALHPALAALHPLYAERRLAVVHAVGSPHPTRSHFDAQDYLESGTPGRKSTRDGWLSRALDALATDETSLTPFSAVSLTATMPRSLASAEQAMAMEDFAKMTSRGIRKGLGDRLSAMYVADSDPAFARAGDDAFAAISMFRRVDPLAMPVRQGVRYPGGRLAPRFQQAAALIKSSLGVRIVFIEGGGWDTHLNQGGTTGPMANLLRELAGSIAALLADVGTDRPVTLVTATEFGRTVAPNGAGGTDHGHGSVALVAGASVAGGRVVGDWPGLERRALYDGRDLAVTTDFRDLFAEVAGRSLDLPAATDLFPGIERQAVGVMTT